jgi:sRNA-binding protein
MRRVVFVALGFVAALLIGIMAYNVWRAETTPITKTPDVVEQGRIDLHNRLAQAEQREAEIEKTYWDSPEKLRILIQSHQKRIDQLKGNIAGGEIVAHDQDAIARLEKRIADIAAQQEAEAKAKAEQAKAEAQAKKAQQAHPDENQ